MAKQNTRPTSEPTEIYLDSGLLRRARAAGIDLDTLISETLSAERHVTDYLRRQGRTELEEGDLPDIIGTLPSALNSLRVRRALAWVRSRHLTMKRRKPKDAALLEAVFHAIRKLQFGPAQFKTMQRHGLARDRKKAADLYLAERAKKTPSSLAARHAMETYPFAFDKAGTLRQSARRRKQAAERKEEMALQGEAIHARLLAGIAKAKRLHSKAGN